MVGFEDVDFGEAEKNKQRQARSEAEYKTIWNSDLGSEG